MFPDIMFIVLAIAAFIYAALCLALFLGQRSFLYYPQAKSAAGDNTLTLNTDGERVLVTTRPRPGSDAVIYFGGNAEDVSRSLPTLKSAFPERSLYALNYRGYGGSTGKPSEPALIADALTLFDRVHIEHPHMIAAQNDEVIPLASTESLHKRLPQSLTTLTVIEGVGHNDISDSPEYVRLLAETKN
jgi:pimeloyl-ACP methyl ester carboxylesterase